MQQEGEPQFIRTHNGIVKGVAFSPKERYIFCSGGTDGKVNLYNAILGQYTSNIKITSPHAMKNVNAVKFNADGSKILATTSKRLSIIDAERGELIGAYDGCAYAGKEKSPLASNPQNANLAICGNSDGKGLNTIDLRKPKPANFALDVHSTLIRDIIYLDESWPFARSLRQGTVASLSLDGVCKIRTDEHELRVLDVEHTSNCVTATPDVYSHSDEDGFESIMMIGGTNLSAYLPGNGNVAPRLFNYGPNERPINKLKYTSNGHLLYAASSGGQLRRYRRQGKRHHFLGEVYSHFDEIMDMDISPNDEYLATASRDGTVGLLCLGAPSYGWTGFMQLA